MKNFTRSGNCYMCKNTGDGEWKPLNYESFLEDREKVILVNEQKLIYAIMFRRWKETCDLIEVIKERGISPEECLETKFSDKEITVKDCFSKNMQFLKHNKNRIYYDKLRELLDENFKKIETNPCTDYDKGNFCNNESVFDLFFKGNQPVLNVNYFEAQTLAARQLWKNKATMVMDEVGTGKTVAGIYAMQQVIQARIDQKRKNDSNGIKSQGFYSAAILIICPYQKREDWNSDVRRQLGRNSIIVSKADNGRIIKQRSYNSNNPLIYIMGCVGGESDDSSSELKKSLKKFTSEKNWDLVIIDECHKCFENYEDIIAEKVMLLTATPIVVNAQGQRNFNAYKNLMIGILPDEEAKKSLKKKEIKPIQKRKPTDDDVFVFNYKEDIFNVTIERGIKFIGCERTDKRQEWFYELKDKEGFFAAMYADQDDNRLKDKINKINKNYENIKNKKLDKLVEIVAGKDSEWIKKSIIIFCELTATVEMIYKKITALISDDETMIGKKYSQVGEIKGVTSNPSVILERLKSHIRSGPKYRAILITTGKSAGVGLNLGEFETVIHYELPYTNNELEQRFGRIERADDLIEKRSNNKGAVPIKNEMIFLVNEAVDGWSDFETNRMLYYAVTKVNIACKYMPIRNTVLFHSAFTKKIMADAKFFQDEIESNNNNNKETIENYIEYKNNEAEIFKMVCKIKEALNDEEKQKIVNKKELKEKINTILNDVKENNKIKDFEVKLKKFYDSYFSEDNENFKNILEFDRRLEIILEYFIWMRNTFRFYGVKLELIDNISFEDENIAYNTNMSNYKKQSVENFDMQYDDGESGDLSIENQYKKDGENLKSEIDLLKKQFITKKNYLESLSVKINKNLKNLITEQCATGIFYFNKDKFYNHSVEEFRKGDGNDGAK